MSIIERYEQGERDFVNVHLEGANLQEVNLQRVNLRWAKLRGANLRGIDLKWADLKWGDLRGADLRGADLQWALLERADLRGSDFREANLQWADLEEADLQGTIGLVYDYEIGKNKNTIWAWMHPVNKTIVYSSGCFEGSADDMRNIMRERADNDDLRYAVGGMFYLQYEAFIEKAENYFNESVGGQKASNLLA